MMLSRPRRALAALAGLAAAATLASAAPTGLYGTTAQTGLASISTTTGALTPVGTPAIQEGQAQQLTALDATRGIYYLLGWNFTTQTANLVGFSVSTGALVVDVPLPFYESAFVGLGQVLAVEPATGQLVGGGLLSDNSSHVFGFIDPTNGSFKQVAALDAALLPVLGGVADFDPLTGTLLTQLGDQSAVYWYSISMRNGSFTRWAEDFTDGKDIQSLNYDAGSGAFYGLGLEPNGTTSYIRTLVRLDATKFTYTTVGAIDSYLVMSGAVAALDATRGVLYWIGQKTAAGVNDPFYLVGVSLKDASVVSAPRLCVTDDVCPWSLEFL